MKRTLFATLLAASFLLPCATAATAVDPLAHPLEQLGTVPRSGHTAGTVVEDHLGNLYAAPEGDQAVYRQQPGGAFAPWVALPGPSQTVRGLAISGTTLAVGAQDGDVFLLDLNQPSPSPSLLGNVGWSIFSLAFDPGGLDLVLGTVNGTYSMALGTGIAAQVTGAGIPQTGTCSNPPGGSTLVCDWMADRILEVSLPAEVSVLVDGLGAHPDGIAVHPATHDVYILLESGGSVVRYVPSTGQISTIVTGIVGLGGQTVSALSFSPDGTELYFMERAGGSNDVIVVGGFPATTEGTIVSPPPGDTVVGHVPISVALQDGDGDDVTVSFDFSVDSGATFTPCATAPTSLLTNPTVPLSTPSLSSYIWDSLNDGVGLSPAQPTELRVTTSDGVHISSETVSITVDNSSCSIPLMTLPGYTARSLGRVDIGSDNCYGGVAEDSTGNVYLSSGPRSSPVVYRRPPQGPFAIYASLPGSHAYGLTVVGTDLYVAVNNRDIYSVDLTDPSPIPVSLATLPANGNRISASRFMDKLLVGTAGDGVYEIALPGGMATPLLGPGEVIKGVAYSRFENLILDPDYSSRTVLEHDPLAATSQLFGQQLPAAADSVTVHPVSGEVFVTPASSSCGNDTIERWDSTGTTRITFATGLAFGSGNDSSPISFSRDGRRMYFATGVGAAQAEVFVVEGFPSLITADLIQPVSGTTLSGNIEVVFDADQLDLLPITATLEYSISTGVWNDCNIMCGSLPNPTPPLATPVLASSYIWNSIDEVGFARAEPVELRLTVSDGVISAVTQTSVIVDNTTHVILDTPICDTTLLGLVPVSFDADDLEGDDLVATLEFSIDGGITFQTATTDALSPLSNPSPPLSTPVWDNVFLWSPVLDGLPAETTTSVVLRINVSDLQGDSGQNQLRLDVQRGADCPGLCGDCDESRRVDILDALSAAKYSVGAGSLTTAGLQLCNVAGHAEGTITVIDALTIARHVVGASSPMSCCP